MRILLIYQALACIVIFEWNVGGRRRTSYPKKKKKQGPQVTILNATGAAVVAAAAAGGRALCARPWQQSCRWCGAGRDSLLKLLLQVTLSAQ